MPDIIAGQQFLNNMGGKFFVISGGTVESSAVDDDDDAMIPKNHLLLTNYPNPFNARTMISYDLPRAADVKLELFNLLDEDRDYPKHAAQDGARSGARRGAR